MSLQTKSAARQRAFLQVGKGRAGCLASPIMPSEPTEQEAYLRALFHHINEWAADVQRELVQAQARLHSLELEGEYE
jgi:hypothetical protein